MREEFRGEGGLYPIPFDPLNPGNRDVPGGGYLGIGPMQGASGTPSISSPVQNIH